MKRIEKLTDAQLARMAEFRDRWIEIGLCTDPADRPAAETAIVETYRAAGLPPPRQIVWCGSPLSQGLTRAIVVQRGDEVGASVRTSVGTSVWDSVGASVAASVATSVRTSVGYSVRTSVGYSVRTSVRDSVRDSVGASVWDSVADSVRDSVWDSVRDSVGYSVYGQHDANWLAFYEFFREVCDLRDQTEKLRGLTALARSAGWALPHSRVCWVSERHNVLRRDARGLLHCDSGPAVLYPDGWAIYAIHGTRIPAEWVENKSTLDPTIALTWQNVEQRRAAAELIGWSRILEQLQPTVVDHDPNPFIGDLLRVDLPDSPGEQFLRVKCGTGRDFALCVPPDIRTAREAQLWMYPGLKPKDLQKIVRT